MTSLSASSLAARGVAYAGAIATAARDHGLDPALLAAVAAQETGGPGTNAGRNVLGDGGHGHGLFQIDDRYHPFARTAAAMDPSQNAEYAAGMLAGLIRRYGSVRAALSAYNAGDPNATGSVTRWSDGATLGYADSVLRHEQRINASPIEDAARDELASATGSIGVLASQAASLPPLPLPAPAHIRSFRDVITDGGADRDQDSV